MYEIKQSGRFKRDLKLVIKRGYNNSAFRNCCKSVVQGGTFGRKVS